MVEVLPIDCGRRSIVVVDTQYQLIVHFYKIYIFITFFGCCDMITDKELNYDDLASGLKAALENDQSVFDADRLQKYTGTCCSWNFFFFHEFFSSCLCRWWRLIAAFLNRRLIMIVVVVRSRVAWTVEMAKTSAFGRRAGPLDARGIFLLAQISSCF